jgi:hypothetical protein
MQLKGPEKNYPVHEKELLMIIHTLKKWCANLLGIPIFVYTDHQTLQNFDTQCNLSRHQLRWQEFISQYDITTVYIPREANSVANALSRIHDGTFPGKLIPTAQTPTNTLNPVLRITTDDSILHEIQTGYQSDEFCKKNNGPLLQYERHHLLQWSMVYW